MVFWQQTLLGNNLLQYALFFGAIAVAVLLGKVIAWISENIVRKRTKDSGRDWDDNLVDVVERPFIFLLFVLGLYFGSNFLTLTVRFDEILTNIVDILLMINAGWFILNLADKFVVNYVRKFTDKTDSDLDDLLLPLIRKLMKFIIVAVTLIMIIDRFGYDITSLVAGLGLGGLAFALAAKDLLGNLFGGVAIATDRPFLLGDRIKMGDVDGFVKDIGLRTTKIETFGGTMLTVPNSKLVDSVVENVSAEPSRRVKSEIGVEYGTSSEKVEEAKEILRGVAEDIEGVQDDCLVSFWEFGDSALKLLFIYYIEDKDDILGRMDAVNTEVKKRLNEADISMAFPTRTVHLEK